MNVTVRHIVDFLQRWAPADLKLSYDNVGLQAGNSYDLVKGVITTLDVTDSVIDEAIEKNANLIIAHHPVIFPSINSITDSSETGRLLIKLIKNSINLFVSHTNLDSVKGGVSFVLADTLGLKQTQFLSDGEGKLSRIEAEIPETQLDAFSKFVSTNSEWVFSHHISNPKNGLVSIQIVLDAAFQSQCVSYLTEIQSKSLFLSKVQGTNPNYGFGVLGTLPENGLTQQAFFTQISEKLGINSFRYSGSAKNIKTVAVCGGSGSFLIKNAIKAKVDAYITADIKYHDYFIDKNGFLLVDIGHYETERFIAQTLQEKVQGAFPELMVVASKVDTNPMQTFVHQNLFKQQNKPKNQ